MTTDEHKGSGQFRRIVEASLIKAATGVLAIAILIAATTAARAQQADSSHHFFYKHQAGVRLGVWANQGGSPPDSGAVMSGGDRTGTFITNINDAAAYFEGFFGYRLNRYWMLQISVGTVNRGSVTITDSVRSDVGNLTIYPVIGQIKLYPFPGSRLKFHPYVAAGGGMYIGRRGVQFTNAWYNTNWEEETELAFNFVAGAGADWPLTQKLGLETQVSYMPISFSDKLLTIKDYDAIAVTIGIKYLYR
jgi:outer membrane protein W